MLAIGRLGGAGSGELVNAGDIVKARDPARGRVFFPLI